MVQSEESVKGHLICAIVTPNYLNQFLILGESIARTMPTADLRVLILQDCSETGFIQERIDTTSRKPFLLRLCSRNAHQPFRVAELRHEVLSLFKFNVGLALSFSDA